MKNVALAALRHGARVPARPQLERFACLEVVRDVLKSLDVDCVLDVGANRGQFGRDLRAIGYPGWIVSFEPSPADIAVLRNYADSRWLSYEIALGEQEGEREFNLVRLSVLNSFLTPTSDQVVDRIAVRTRRIDTLLDEIRERTRAKRPFLKLDTQGFDIEVVKGAGERIRAFVGLLSELSVTPIYEGMPHYLDALKLYESLGFRLHSLHVVNRDANGAVLEYDGLLLR